MADTGTVDRDGFMLKWVREGHGLPMLVLGGQFYPRYFPKAMREHFEMVFCDLRQWAATPEGYDVGTITRDTFSEDVDALRRAVGFDRPIVAGQSQHGAIALAYAQHFPDKPRGVLAIAAPAPRSDGHDLESSEDFFQRDATPERLAAHEHNLATRRVPESTQTSQDFIDEYVLYDAMGWYDHTFDCSPLWEGVEINVEVENQVFEPAVLGGFEMPALDVPVFLSLGRYDYFLPYYMWDEPKKRLANLRYKLYDKSGHHPPYEQPEEFTADVVEWASSL